MHQTTTSAATAAQSSGEEISTALPRRWRAVAVGGVLAGLTLSALNAVKSVAVPIFATEWNTTLARLGIDMTQANGNPVMLAFFAGSSVAGHDRVRLGGRWVLRP